MGRVVALALASPERSLVCLQLMCLVGRTAQMCVCLSVCYVCLSVADVSGGEVFEDSSDVCLICLSVVDVPGGEDSPDLCVSVCLICLSVCS